MGAPSTNYSEVKKNNIASGVKINKAIAFTHQKGYFKPIIKVGNAPSTTIAEIAEQFSAGIPISCQMENHVVERNESLVESTREKFADSKSNSAQRCQTKDIFCNTKKSGETKFAT